MMGEKKGGRERERETPSSSLLQISTNMVFRGVISFPLFTSSSVTATSFSWTLGLITDKLSLQQLERPSSCKTSVTSLNSQIQFPTLSCLCVNALHSFSSFSPNTDEANDKLEKVFEDLVQEQRLGTFCVHTNSLKQPTL